MYRVGAAFAGVSILRVGTVDDFGLHGGVLRPGMEQFARERVGWWGGLGGEGVRVFEGDGLHVKE